MPTKKQTFHEGEIKYLLSRAIRYGINVGRESNLQVQTKIDDYINEVLPSFMSKAKPTAGSDKPYKKVKANKEYEDHQLRLYTSMYGQ